MDREWYLQKMERCSLHRLIAANLKVHRTRAKISEKSFDSMTTERFPKTIPSLAALDTERKSIRTDTAPYWDWPCTRRQARCGKPKTVPREATRSISSCPEKITAGRLFRMDVITMGRKSENGHGRRGWNPRSYSGYLRSRPRVWPSTRAIAFLHGKGICLWAR